MLLISVLLSLSHAIAVVLTAHRDRVLFFPFALPCSLEDVE
jgi:hypothetical protein